MTTNNAVNSPLSGTTGTGNFVGSTSPTLITPTLGAASATSINFGGSTLSTYQTGTFTPTLVGSGGGSATYSSQTGAYTQIGNTIFFRMLITITASTLSGNITISGLPVSVTFLSSVSIFGTSLGATATPMLMGQVSSGSTTLFLYVFAAGAASQLTATNLGSTASLTITGHYI